jgi:hypothetical protein
LQQIKTGEFKLKSVKKEALAIEGTKDDEKEADRTMDIYDLEPLGVFQKTGHGMIQNIISLNFAQKRVKRLDLTGVVLNDFIIYRICELIKTKNKADWATLDLNKTKLNGSRFISIWSLHWLIKAAFPENKEISLLKLCQEVKKFFVYCVG